MTARYRLVHFEPEFVTGSRYALGALVETDDGIRFVRAERTPDARCLGGEARFVLANMVMEVFEQHRRFDELPPDAGPYVALAEAVEIPDDAKDPKSFVRGLFDPVGFEADTPVLRIAGGGRRSRAGMAYFQRLGVQRYIQKQFDPAKQLRTILNGSSGLLRKVTHYVAGRDELLLMEPLLPRHVTFEKELLNVAALLGSYRDAFTRRPKEHAPRLVAYVLRDGPDELRAQAIRRLRANDFTTYDCAADRESSEFAAKITSVAQSAEPDPYA